MYVVSSKPRRFIMLVKFARGVVALASSFLTYLGYAPRLACFGA